MAKKTVKVDLKSAGAEPAAGDVNISYKGTRIVGLSESSTAILKTENTIVQDDIEVEYTKNAGVEPVTLPMYKIDPNQSSPEEVSIGNMTAYPGQVVTVDLKDTGVAVVSVDGYSDEDQMAIPISTNPHNYGVVAFVMPDPNHSVEIEGEFFPEITRLVISYITRNI
jgi:hypothetical protein